MAEVDVFADAEAVAIKHLRTDQTITQNRVYGEVPPDPTFPLITLHRSGGLPADDRVLDGPLLQIDIWGGGSSTQHKAEARYAGAQARASLKRLEGQRVSVLMDGSVEVGGHVTSVADVMGLTHLEDPDTDRHRYTFMVALTIRAL